MSEEEKDIRIKELETFLQEDILGVLTSKVKNYKSSKKIFEVIKQTCDEFNIPTKLITLTYNNETVISRNHGKDKCKK